MEQFGENGGENNQLLCEIKEENNETQPLE